MQPPDGCGVSSERDESDFIFTSPHNEENKVRDGQSERNKILQKNESDASILRVSRLAVL